MEKHMLAGRWSISESVATFLIGDKLINESTRTSAQLAQWLCKKRLGFWEATHRAVEAADFSAKGAKFQLLRLALLERADAFFDLLRNVLQSGSLTAEELSSLPWFEEIRNDNRFGQFVSSVEEQALDGNRRETEQ
jgi:hypothetical protein